MPAVIALKDCVDSADNPISDMYFLIMEQDFPYQAVELLQQRIRDFTQLEKNYTKEDIIAIAEGTIAEYNGTLIPFVLYLVSCNPKK